MAKPNTELDALGIALRGEASDGATQSQPAANATVGRPPDRPGSLSAIGWSIFGSMRRGWVILILSLLGWAALVAVVLAIVGLF